MNSHDDARPHVEPSERVAGRPTAGPVGHRGEPTAPGREAAFDPSDWTGDWVSFEQFIGSDDPAMRRAWDAAEQAVAGSPMAVHGIRAFWTAACRTVSDDNPVRIGGWRVAPRTDGGDGLVVTWLAEDGSPLHTAAYRLVDMLARGLEAKPTLVFRADADGAADAAGADDADGATGNGATGMNASDDNTDANAAGAHAASAGSGTDADGGNADDDDAANIAVQGIANDAAHRNDGAATSPSPFDWLLAIAPMPSRGAHRDGGLLSHLHFQYASRLDALVDPETRTLRDRRWYATMCDATGDTLDRCNVVLALHRLPAWRELP